MIAHATLPKLEPCPVCFNDDLSSLKQLNGCGHSVCGDCKRGMYTVQNQFVNWMKVFRKDNKRIILKLMKCPICRTIEKPTLELLEENSRLGFVGICNVVNPNPVVNPNTLVNRILLNAFLRQNPIRRASRTRALSSNPLLPCQRTGCRRKCRTRGRCPNHPDVGCCETHSGCDQCH